MSCRGGVREIVVEAFPFDTPVLWRAAKVRAVTGLPERALRTGGFPKAVPLDARQVAWVANEVIAWNNIMGTAASRREPAVRKVCAVMDTIPRDAPVLWRLEKVCEVTGLTARSVRNRERIGKFPKAVPLDARQVAFVADEVIGWVTEQIAARDAGVKPAGYDEFAAARKRGGEARAKKLQARGVAA